MSDKDKWKDEVPEFDPDSLPPELRDALKRGDANMAGFALPRDVKPGTPEFKAAINDSLTTIAELMSNTVATKEALSGFAGGLHGVIMAIRIHSNSADRGDVGNVFLKELVVKVDDCCKLVVSRIRDAEAAIAANASKDELEAVAAKRDLDGVTLGVKNVVSKYAEHLKDRLAITIAKTTPDNVFHQMANLEEALVNMAAFTDKVKKTKTQPIGAPMSVSEMAGKSCDEIISQANGWLTEEIPEAATRDAEKRSRKFSHLISEGLSEEDAMVLTFDGEIDQESKSREAFIEWLVEKTS
jgi:hypothetical protein